MREREKANGDGNKRLVDARRRAVKYPNTIIVFNK